jgi:hypothetical protein
MQITNAKLDIKANIYAEGNANRFLSKQPI